MRAAKHHPEANRAEDCARAIDETPLAFDPIVARMEALEAFGKEDRLRWISAARTRLIRARGELRNPAGEFGEIINEGRSEMIEMQLHCLDRLDQAARSESD